MTPNISFGYLDFRDFLRTVSFNNRILPDQLVNWFTFLQWRKKVQGNISKTFTNVLQIANFKAKNSIKNLTD